MPVDAVAARKEALYLAQLPELKAIPPVLEQVEKQYGRIPLGVVSGSRRDSVVGSLTALGLMDKFDTLVCAEDYTHGKPAPDAFLLGRPTAQRRACSLPCLRRHRTRHRGGHGSRHGLGARPPNQLGRLGNRGVATDVTRIEEPMPSIALENESPAAPQSTSARADLVPLLLIAAAVAFAAHSHQRPLRLPSRRAAVSLRRTPHGLGLRGLPTFHPIRRAHQPWRSSACRSSVCASSLFSRRPRDRHRHRPHGARTRRQPSRSGHGRAGRRALSPADFRRHRVSILDRSTICGGC